MLDQRDDHMTDGLLNKCSGRTVAVVGMAHMDGIESGGGTRWAAAEASLSCGNVWFG